MSIKGNCVDTIVNPSREEPHFDIICTMGLYVNDDHSTRPVALGKVYKGASTVHHVHLADDVVKVVVEEV